MDKEKVEIIVGPPGTGKTTSLIERLEKDLETIHPSRIAYLAFTRQAANIARDRAMKKFSFKEKDLPYFRTIHSLSYARLGISHESVINRQHYEHLGELLGVKITGHAPSEDGYLAGLELGDRMLQLINRARVRRVSLEDEYKSSKEDFGWWELDRMNRGVQEYKDKHGLIDFTDMIDDYTSRGSVPKLDVIYVDEAQDLSRLQWEVIDKLADVSKARVVIAGDDDQAIFRWAGADVERFIHMDGKASVLKQSYRVPRNVQAIANRIVGRISDRREKLWSPRDDEGEVHHIQRIVPLPLLEEDWLILARNKAQLQDVAKHLRHNGVFYSWFNSPSVTSKNVDAIVSYSRWVKLKNFDDLKRASHMMSTRTYHTVLKASEPPVWFEALDKITPLTRQYIRALLRRKQDIRKEPTVHLSTIHSAKGGQARNVILFTDMIGRTFEEFRRNPDDEIRVFYVGVTRAIQRLFIVRPRTNKFFKI